jgi:hypothetical protein
MIRGFRRRSSELAGFPLFGDEAKIVVDLAYYAGLFPSFAFRSILGSRFVRFPASLGEDPAASSGGLDKEHVVLVGGERNYAGDESLALRTVACGRISLRSGLYYQIMKKGKMNFRVNVRRSREHLRWLTRPVRDSMGSDAVAAIVAAEMLKEVLSRSERHSTCAGALHTARVKEGHRHRRAQAVKGSRTNSEGGSR